MIQEISLVHLSIALIPAFIAISIIFLWSQNYRSGLYGVARMLTQLLMIGYFLTYIFESNSAWIIIIILAVMVSTSSWIALRSIPNNRWKLYKYTFASILVGGGTTLLLITQGVLGIDPWYEPHYIIPLAGMIFSSAMDSVSLAAERFYAEKEHKASYQQARSTAFQAALIPSINSLFAVGIVSLPGMMTGQILSGVSPLIAVRYQIMVMSMLFGASTIAVACFLILIKRVKY
jgi:putative ABC transport system permease protein